MSIVWDALIFLLAAVLIFFKGDCGDGVSFSSPAETTASVQPQRRNQERSCCIIICTKRRCPDSILTIPNVVDNITIISMGRRYVFVPGLPMHFMQKGTSSELARSQNELYLFTTTNNLNSTYSTGTTKSSIFM